MIGYSWQAHCGFRFNNSGSILFNTMSAPSQWEYLYPYDVSTTTRKPRQRLGTLHRRSGVCRDRALSDDCLARNWWACRDRTCPCYLGPLDSTDNSDFGHHREERMCSLDLRLRKCVDGPRADNAESTNEKTKVRSRGDR